METLWLGTLTQVCSKHGCLWKLGNWKKGAGNHSVISKNNHSLLNVFSCPSRHWCLSLIHTIINEMINSNLKQSKRLREHKIDGEKTVSSQHDKTAVVFTNGCGNNWFHNKTESSRKNSIAKISLMTTTKWKTELFGNLCLEGERIMLKDEEVEAQREDGSRSRKGTCSKLGWHNDDAEDEVRERQTTGCGFVLSVLSKAQR